LGEEAVPKPDHRIGVASAMTSAEVTSRTIAKFVDIQEINAAKKKKRALIVNQGGTVATSAVF